MKCHYEILGVPRDVDNEELKKTYRKLALQWHPDKNPDNIDEATHQFRLIQQAYEVLADPHERAFYDRYRESILRAGQGKSSEELLDLFQYFNCSCYSGYNDGEKGFYTVYREVFSKIAVEDEKFDQGSDESGDDDEVPEFGKSDSDYDEVVHRFYAYWLSYCTKSSYVWLNKYDLRDAPNRRVVRLMEKENKKIREQARKKRNEEIRALVEFVRKRDKRVQQHRKLLEEKSAANAKKAEENRRRQLEDRRKCLESYQESDWTTMAQVEDILQDMEANIVKEFGDSQDEESKSDDEQIQDLYCIACDRAFKSAKAFENHENSKKHKENFSLLKTAMEEEEMEFNESTTNDRLSQNDFDDDDDDYLTLLSTKKNKKTKKQKKKKKFIPQLDSDDEEAAAIITSPKVDETILTSPTLEEPIVDEPLPPTDTKENIEKRKKTKKTQKKTKQKQIQEPTLTCVTCNSVFPSRNKLFQHLTKSGHSKLLPK